MLHYHERGVLSQRLRHERRTLHVSADRLTEQMRRFLKYEMDRYLIGRSVERKKELPLEQVENQGYIHYNKASVVFYALQDYVGEEKVNQALREYVQAVAYQNPP